MLKTRLIPVLFIMNGLIVRSEGFKVHQNIGNIINQAQRYNDWSVDELIYIDISRGGQHNLRRDDHKIQPYSEIDEVISRIGAVCFMPLTFGGGIRTIEDAALRIRLGADKVTINSAAIANSGLIGEIAGHFGSQAVIVSVDYRVQDGKALVHTNFGQTNTGIQVEDWIKECVARGAGEILLNSIDRDGMATGYDLDTVSRCVGVSRVPVIACGGASEFHDFVEVVRETGVAAVAAGNVFHFTERSYPRAKELMKRGGVNVRV
jgi:cyclase